MRPCPECLKPAYARKSQPNVIMALELPSKASISAQKSGIARARRAGGWKEIPGIGPIVATALVAEVGVWQEFRSGRNLAAWIGLVPRQHTTGGKDRLGSITKQGNRYLRWLLVAGAMAVIRYAQKHGTERRPWLGRLMERRPTRDELLNGEIFYSLRDAQVVIEQWRQHYNTVRPHSSLGYRPPAPEVIMQSTNKTVAARPRLN
jgi:hypothetical protein